MGHRIVLATIGSYGDVNPYLGLSLALKARGHQPVIATGAFYRETIERAGIEFQPVRPDADPTDRAMLARIMDPKLGTEYILRDLVLAHLRDSYDDLSRAARGADALITHPITFAGPVVAQQQHLTWISTVLAPISFFSAYELPVFSQFPWMRHAAKLGLWATRPLVRFAKRMTVPWMQPLHQLRVELGLPVAMNPIFEGQHSPELVLALFPRVLAGPQPDWPARVDVTGSIFYDGHGMPADVAAELEAFLAAGPPPVVFTLGTSAVNAAGDFFQQSLQAVKQLGCRALMLVGRHRENRPHDAVPDTVKLLEFAPHSVVFPRAAVVVHQGGMGTSSQALRAGRPMLVVPFAHDQPDNAHRLQRLGLAEILYPRQYRADRVAQQLRRLLDQPTYAQRAQVTGDMVRQEPGAAGACDLIEALLRRSDRSASA